MIVLNLHPFRSDVPLAVTRTGTTLELNGATLDLSLIPEGADLAASAIDSPWIVGTITHADGVINVPLRLPHGTDAPEATRFPEDITVTEDGPVDLPPYQEPKDA